MWLAEDIEYALAWQQLDKLRCGGCGHLRDESMDPANQNAYAATSVRCFACQAKDDVSERASETGMDRSGLYFVTVREEDGRG